MIPIDSHSNRFEVIGASELRLVAAKWVDERGGEKVSIFIQNGNEFFQLEDKITGSPVYNKVVKETLLANLRKAVKRDLDGITEVKKDDKVGSI